MRAPAVVPIGKNRRRATALLPRATSRVYFERDEREFAVTHPTRAAPGRRWTGDAAPTASTDAPEVRRVRALFAAVAAEVSVFVRISLIARVLFFDPTEAGRERLCVQGDD